MAKLKISDFDTNPDNNTDINSINIAEGCAPSGINNAIRQLMSDLKEFQTGAGGDPFNGAVNGTVGATTPAAGTFTTVTANTSVSTDIVNEKTSGAGVTLDGVLLKDNAVSASNGFTQASTFNSASTMGFKNRIINGAMMIDQRNAGASFALVNTDNYIVDRWFARQNTDGGISAQRDTVAPTGFINSFKATVTSADSSLSSTQFSYVSQVIEGFNTADLGWGTASAATVTLSFWVRSSLTGTFAGSVGNYDGNNSYVFNYVINAANTWEYKTVTVTGATTGTWNTGNSGSLRISFDLGSGSNRQGTVNSWNSGSLWSSAGATSVVGTSGATFYITGVQLEKGSTATSFDYRPYGTELALCQRYYQTYQKPVARGVMNGTTNLGRIGLPLQVQMRASPTLNIIGTIDWFDASGVGTITALNATYTTTNAIEFDALAATGTTALGRPAVLYNGSNTGSLTASAEL